MIRNILWVTGPSAAGKTFVLNKLSGLLSNSIVLTDAAEMLFLNDLDTGHQHHIHPDGKEGFLLTSTYHFDESVRRISKKLLEKPEDQMALVELARGLGDYTNIDLSYARLLGLIPETVFERSSFLYIQASWEERIARNVERRTFGYAQYLERQSFYVPVEAMEGFFRKDDFNEVKDRFPCPVYILENNGITPVELEKRISNAAEILHRS